MATFDFSGSKQNHSDIQNNNGNKNRNANKHQNVHSNFTQSQSILKYSYPSSTSQQNTSSNGPNTNSSMVYSNGQETIKYNYNQPPFQENNLNQKPNSSSSSSSHPRPNNNNPARSNNAYQPNNQQTIPSLYQNQIEGSRPQNGGHQQNAAPNNMNRDNRNSNSGDGQYGISNYNQSFYNSGNNNNNGGGVGYGGNGGYGGYGGSGAQYNRTMNNHKSFKEYVVYIKDEAHFYANLEAVKEGTRVIAVIYNEGKRSSKLLLSSFKILGMQHQEIRVLMINYGRVPKLCDTLGIQWRPTLMLFKEYSSNSTYDGILIGLDWLNDGNDIEFGAGLLEERLFSNGFVTNMRYDPHFKPIPYNAKKGPLVHDNEYNMFTMKGNNKENEDGNNSDFENID